MADKARHISQICRVILRADAPAKPGGGRVSSVYGTFRTLAGFICLTFQKHSERGGPPRDVDRAGSCEASLTMSLSVAGERVPLEFACVKEGIVYSSAQCRQ
jgi:hypothetical protein